MDAISKLIFSLDVISGLSQLVALDYLRLREQARAVVPSVRGHEYIMFKMQLIPHSTGPSVHGSLGIGESDHFYVTPIVIAFIEAIPFLYFGDVNELIANIFQQSQLLRPHKITMHHSENDLVLNSCFIQLLLTSINKDGKDKKCRFQNTFSRMFYTTI